MVRSHHALMLGAVLLLAGTIVWQASSRGAQDGGEAKAKPASLPIRQVVLFNSGVGYFQREGEIDGTSRVDLTFPADDINDLLKSLVLQDVGGGLISTVNTDSHDPVEKVLRSFAIDLNNNPGFGQILNQARGEKIEIVYTDKPDAPPVRLAGTMVGMEVQRQALGFADVEMLNCLGPSGLQSVPLARVASVKFANPAFDNDFQRALKVLAGAHDVQKKSVSLGFQGAGKRAVRVGYVLERPIWKTSYRLRLEPGGKVFVQGWALVENPSDDDWNDVRMVLVSGKPISFRMNLYEPIYIPRPFVEPEHFASLRPPLYSAPVEAAKEEKAQVGGMFGQFGMGGNFGQMGAGPPPLGGQVGGQLGGQLGQFGQFGFGGQMGQYGGASRSQPVPGTNRLTYEELQQRRQQRAAESEEAKKAGAAITGLNFKEGIQSVATSDVVGDYFQYILDQKITVPRQKTAMVPILDQTIEGAKVSIFNEGIHGKFPLLGLRLKNSSGKPLTQGPITVYDAGHYAGDTRILDLPPGEERLLSYALDQNTEIKTALRDVPGSSMQGRLDEPTLALRYTMRQTKTYTIKNRSTHDRTVIVEHPRRSGWKLAGAKPDEQTRDVYRFSVPVQAGKTAKLEVAEEQPRVEQLALGGRKVPGAVAGVTFKSVTHPSEDKVIEIKFQQTMMRVVRIVREAKTLFVHNLSDRDSDFVIDHTTRPGWTVRSTEGEVKGPGTVQFKLTVPRGKALSKVLVEEQTRVEQRALRSDGTPDHHLGLGLVFRTQHYRYADRLIGFKIQKGILQTTRRVRDSDVYTVQNNSDEDRVFIIDHPVRPGWLMLDDKDEAGKTTPEIFRFELAASRGKAVIKELKEESTAVDAGQPLSQVGEATLRAYASHRAAGAAVKTALNEALRHNAVITDTMRQIAEMHAQLEELSRDQTRLRSNLQIVPQTSEHYKKILDKFIAQETGIENLQRQKRTLQAGLQNQQRDYQAFLARLDAD